MDLEKRFRYEDLGGLPRADGPLLKKAINLLKNNKSCAGDMVVAEMLSVLDEDIFETMAEAFTMTLFNTESQYVWKVIYPYAPKPDIFHGHKCFRISQEGGWLKKTRTRKRRQGVTSGTWQARIMRTRQRGARQGKVVLWARGRRRRGMVPLVM